MNPRDNLSRFRTIIQKFITKLRSRDRGTERADSRRSRRIERLRFHGFHGSRVNIQRQWESSVVSAMRFCFILFAAVQRAFRARSCRAERVAATRGRGTAVEIAGEVSRRRDTPIETPTSHETHLAARRSLMFRGFNRRGGSRSPEVESRGCSSGHVRREKRDGYNV